MVQYDTHDTQVPEGQMTDHYSAVYSAVRARSSNISSPHELLRAHHLFAKYDEVATLEPNFGYFSLCF